MEKPTVIFEDVKVEGRVREYLNELFQKTTVISPAEHSLEQINTAKQTALVWVSRIKQMDPSDLSKMRCLKMISAWGVGYDHIKVPEATLRKIPVCNNPVFSRSLAESALLFILALSKRLPHLTQDALSGRPLSSARGVEIRGKTVGLIGFGRIGRETADLCQRLDMSVVAYDPYIVKGNVPAWCQLVSLNQLLENADFIILTAPLTPESIHMIAEPQFKLMKPTAYLVNIARGPLVDENALRVALETEQIAGAALDAWEVEPVQKDNPLLRFENIIPTPPQDWGNLGES